MKMARKAMKKLAMKELLGAMMKKNNNERLISVTYLLTNFQHARELSLEVTLKLMIVLHLCLVKISSTKSWRRQTAMLAKTSATSWSTERHNQSQSESLLWNVRYHGDEYTSQSCQPLEARHVYGQ